jgi:membrane-bound lytic murein transglycosylase MltF
MGYAHMLDAMALTKKQKGNPEQLGGREAASAAAKPETITAD